MKGIVCPEALDASRSQAVFVVFHEEMVTNRISEEVSEHLLVSKV